MSTEVDVEQLQTTKSEKLLAVVLAAFLLLGAVWAYQEVDDRVRRELPVRSPSAAEQAPIRKLDTAQGRLYRAQNRVRRTRSELTLRREAYRTALDADEPADTLRRRYLAANEAYESAVAARVAAQRAVRAAQPAASAASSRIAAEEHERRDLQELVIALIRLGAASAFIVLAYWLLARMRNRGSRYLPLGAAAVGFATVFAFVVAVDYLTDYFDPLDLGLLYLSLLGVLATLVAFWALQRYLARRLPSRRVRKHECPFCGYPVAENRRCEGCGREVLGSCASCESPRRVGTPRCGACGAA
jgi:hypothetical protein